MMCVACVKVSGDGGDTELYKIALDSLLSNSFR